MTNLKSKHSKQLPEFFVHIAGNEITNTKVVRKAFKDLADGRYLVKIEKAKKRSNSQNAYLHGVMIPMVLQGLKDAGFDEVRTTEDAKVIIKSLFLKREFVSKETGDMIGYIKDTHMLTTVEMGELIEAVIKWAQEYLSITIPYPNEQLLLNY